MPVTTDSQASAPSLAGDRATTRHTRANPQAVDGMPSDLSPSILLQCSGASDQLHQSGEDLSFSTSTSTESALRVRRTITSKTPGKKRDTTTLRIEQTPVSNKRSKRSSAAPPVSTKRQAAEGQDGSQSIAVDSQAVKRSTQLQISAGPSESSCLEDSIPQGEAPKSSGTSSAPLLVYEPLPESVKRDFTRSSLRGPLPSFKRRTIPALMKNKLPGFTSENESGSNQHTENEPGTSAQHALLFRPDGDLSTTAAERQDLENKARSSTELNDVIQINSPELPDFESSSEFKLLEKIVPGLSDVSYLRDLVEKDYPPTDDAKDHPPHYTIRYESRNSKGINSSIQRSTFARLFCSEVAKTIRADSMRKLKFDIRKFEKLEPVILDIKVDPDLWKSAGEIKQLKALRLRVNGLDFAYKSHGAITPPGYVLSRIDFKKVDSVRDDKRAIRKIVTRVLASWRTWQDRFLKKLQTYELVGFAGLFSTERKREGKWLKSLYLIYKVPLGDDGAYDRRLGKYLLPYADVGLDRVAYCQHDFRVGCSECKLNATTIHKSRECPYDCKWCHKPGHIAPDCPNNRRFRKGTDVVIVMESEPEDYETWEELYARLPGLKDKIDAEYERRKKVKLERAARGESVSSSENESSDNDSD